MDIEQLKLILDTVNSAAGGAQNVALAWLIISAVKPILITGVVIYGVSMTLGKVVGLIRTISLSAEFSRDLAKKHEVEITDYTGEVCRSGIHKLRTKVGLV